MKNRLTAIVIALVFLAGAGWLWFGLEPGSSSGPVASTPSAVWPAGTRHTYRFEYGSEESVRPLADLGKERVAGDAIQGALQLRGELVVETSPEPNGQLELRITRLDLATLSVNHQPVPGLDGILTSAGLAFQRGPRGLFQQYVVPEGAHPLVVQTLRGLGMRMQVAAPEGASEARFEAQEELPHGKAHSIYERTGEGKWTRQRPRYDTMDVSVNLRAAPDVELAARADLELDAKGALVGLSDTESITVSAEGTELLRGSSSLTLTRLDAAELLGRAVLAGRAHAMAEVPTSDALEKRLQAERTEGLTREAALEMLTKHMNEGTLPDHRRSLWRLTGLLEMEPELAKDLEGLLLRENTSSKGRALVLDVLVSVGHDEAQAAVRNALDSEVSKKDPSRSVHYQRLGLIDFPNLDTLRFVQRDFDAAQASGSIDGRMLSAYTAGAVAGHARQSTDPALRSAADALGTSVSGLLAAADTPVEQKHLIKALSNVKDERFHAQIAGFVSSPDHGVRESAARAFREPVSALGRSHLLGLVRDQNPFVQTEAIRALEKHPLEDAEWDRITQVITNNGLHVRNHRILLDFVKYRRATSREATTRLLEAMLTQKLEGEVAGAVRLLLEQ